MAVTHLIHVILRPGIQSIQVQYKYQSAEVWTNYSEGQRIPGGVVVKFTVTTYPNFTLTEWDAYYSDEYDDTVNLPLSSIHGESAWTFTLPSADVYIRCEAESTGSHGEPVYDDWCDMSPETTPAILTVTETKTINEILDLIFYYTGWSGGRDKFLSLDLTNAISIRCTENYQTSSIYTFNGAIAYSNNVSIVIGDTYNFPPGPPVIDREFRYLNITVMNNVVTNIAASPRITGAQGINYVGAQYLPDTAVGWYVEGCVFNGVWTYPELINNSIRYIMSPENSGELDASAPSEFINGTIEFTFKWKIKAAYEFRRLTPFAVGEGSLEDDIVYSLDSYDGDTRTYTFTVTQIPDWAIGVRVIIETIYVPDDQSASGTNASDGPIGGDGTFDDTSDEVPLPAIPEGISAADSGFVTLFRPSITQLKDLGNYLWSNLDEFWENLQKIFTNPMDYIIGLNIFPVSPSVGADKAIYIGNWLTNISMPPVNNQFYEFDCGVCTIDKYFGSFLDYGPNTSARIMLPFIGDRDLAINEIMGKTLHLWYRINLLSGECLAALTINNSTYYQWNGNCAIPIPVTGSDWSRLYGGIGRVVGAGAGLALGGLIGMGIGSAMGAAATAGSNVNYVPFTGVDNQTHYKRIGAHAPYDRASQLAPDPTREPPREEFGLSLPAKAALAATTSHIVGNNIMGATPRVARSGDISGGISIMGNRTPYIVLEYPNVNLPENYKHLYGYPSNQYVTLGNLSGYTECKAVMFESTTATDDEVDLIIRTLKSGVYL